MSSGGLLSDFAPARLSKYHLGSTKWRTGRSLSATVGISIRVAAAVTACHFLRVTDVPSTEFTFSVLAVCSIVVAGVRKPWQQKGGVRAALVLSKGFMLALALCLWTHYLKHVGPTRAVLCEQAGAVLLPVLLATCVASPARCAAAVALILIALHLFRTPPHFTSAQAYLWMGYYPNVYQGDNGEMKARSAWFLDTVGPFASGVLLAMATAGSKSSANASNLPNTRRQYLEQPYMIAAATLWTVPMALSQHFGGGGPRGADGEAASTGGERVGLGLVVGALMIVVLAMDVAPGLLVPPMRSSASTPKYFVYVAAALCVPDMFAGEFRDIGSIIVCAALMGTAARVLTGWALDKAGAAGGGKKGPNGKGTAYGAGGGVLGWAGVASGVVALLEHVWRVKKQRRLAIFLVINASFMVVEFLCGAADNSIGLMSDACHMLFDNASIAIGMYAAFMAQRPASAKYTYGFARFEVLSGFANAVLLVFVALLIVLESIGRIMDPPHMSTDNLMLVSIVGLVVNIVGLCSFHEAHLHGVPGGENNCPFHDHSDGGGCGDHGVADTMVLAPAGEHVAMMSAAGEVRLVDVDTGEQSHVLMAHPQGTLTFNNDGTTLTSVDANGENSVTWDVTSGAVVSGTPLPVPKAAGGRAAKGAGGLSDHNMRAMFLHVLADTLGSVGVIVSTFFMERFGWAWTDPAAAVFISVLIIGSVSPLIQQSAEVLLLRTPRGKEDALRSTLKDLLTIEGVHNYQRAHFWSNTPTSFMGSVRVTVIPGANKQKLVQKALTIFRDAGIADMVVQVEDAVFLGESIGGKGGGGSSGDMQILSVE